MRWGEVAGRVTLLRMPSNFSNGNTFDWQGRQLSCEHSTARLVRYNWEGPWPEVLAESYEGKSLNAPNDVVVRPEDDGIVFTDPGYGSHWWYERNVRELELPTSVYHLDPKNGQLTRITDEIFKPNGLAFAPDYSVLYIADPPPRREGQDHRLGCPGQRPPAYQPARLRCTGAGLPRRHPGRRRRQCLVRDRLRRRGRRWRSYLRPRPD